MVELVTTFERLQSQKILVVGDLMLDCYTIGKARRISPEAPVPVVHVVREEERAGGAGNVMLNLLSLGAEVVAFGRVGQDKAGARLKDYLDKEGVEISSVFEEAGYATPIKNRIIADSQQMVRVDHETVAPLSEEMEQKLMQAIPGVLEKVSVVAISDYGKGALTPKFLHALIVAANGRGIPVITDPKGVDFARYRGTTAIKPNQSEAYHAANLPLDAPIEAVAQRLFEGCAAEEVWITRSEKGISWFSSKGEQFNSPAKVHEVKDVTGAGDTVLAMLAVARANGLSAQEAAQLCNIAAGIAIERFGCARVTLGEVARKLLKEQVSHKVFDAQHLFALKAALKGHPYQVLKLENGTKASLELYQQIRKMGEQSKQDLVVATADCACDGELISFLTSLQEVDFIVPSLDLLDRL